MRSSDNIIYVLGPRVRSGTNYLSNFLNVHPEISVIPLNNTRLEAPWLDKLDLFDTAWKNFDQLFSQRFFFRLSKKLEFNDFCAYLSSAFLNYLKDSFEYDVNAKYLLLKNPSFVNLNMFFKAFPNGKLILIVRDGRDNVVSSTRAYIRKSNSAITLTRIKKYINRWTFREFILTTMYWSKSIDTLVSFLNSEEYRDHEKSVLVIRYEDLVNHPDVEAMKIFSFLNLRLSEEVLSKIEELKVVGSSFYGPDGNEHAMKPNWTVAVSKSNAFKPVGRWKNWSGLKKWLFKRIAGKQLISMGYEKDYKW